MTETKRILMERDNLTSEEVDEAMSGIRKMVADGASLEDIEDALHYDLGLEPDYIFDFIWFVHSRLKFEGKYIDKYVFALTLLCEG